MRKSLTKGVMAALIAVTLVPVAAQAQISRGEARELQRDRQDIRQERRDLDRAYRRGDPRDIRAEQRDLRGARQEFREDRRDAFRDGNWGRNDWRQYRNTNRDFYRGGNWRADFRYQQFRPGWRINRGFYDQRFFINDFNRFHLPRPGFNQRWVRHYNDVLLVDTRRGFVVDVLRGFYF